MISNKIVAANACKDKKIQAIGSYENTRSRQTFDALHHLQEAFSHSWGDAKRGK